MLITQWILVSLFLNLYYITVQTNRRSQTQDRGPNTTPKGHSNLDEYGEDPRDAGL